VCEEGGKCDVRGADNRIRCQFCRFQACLKAGMKSKFVLTPEQKSVRFRRHLIKKREKAKHEEEEEGTKSPDLEDEELQMEIILIEEKEDEVMKLEQHHLGF